MILVVFGIPLLAALLFSLISPVTLASTNAAPPSVLLTRGNQFLCCPGFNVPTFSQNC